ncbi:vacuolar protein sorting-associated protein 11 homolog [Bolinopsis microptera]|uniref:vacuolar protein sorting-associated protein 11 homolog n=1 Tax=Bolinopsis microptera TaxID=2820187 RepID=UPI0030794C3E
MVSHQWRRFAFFSKEVVKDENGDKWSGLQDIDITCTASGRGKLLIGDSKGHLHCLTQDMKDVEVRKLYETRLTHLVQIPKAKQNIVVTVGEDEPAHPILRVWNMTPRLADSGCVRYVDLTTLSKTNVTINVTCIVVSDNMSNMAVGLADGTVWLFYKHDITREQRYKVIHSDKASITGLAFNKEVALFVATETAVHSYKRVSDSNPLPTFLSSEGCGLGLSLLTDHHQYHQFLIAPKNKFLFFTVDDPGNNLPMDGTRSHIAWYRGCLVSVSFARRTMLKQDSICDLTIYDMSNKFIGFTGTFPPVKALLVEWGSLYVIGKNNEIYKLNEKGIQEKIDILKRKCLYDDAIQLAKNNQDDHMNLIKAHGDHLASKGDHDGAISKYIGTIGHVEPSYVIRKFLDARRIHNLTQYLEALHEANVANQDHTTLLLNCYTKLKNVQKLEQFIRSEGELNFDVETAIKVCRQATYFDDAAYLAKKFNQYDWYVHIQIEDKQDYRTALDYINELPSLDKKKENVKNFGKQLMDHLPEDMTEFLIQLCGETEDPPPPEEFIPLFVNRNDCLILFLEAIVDRQPESSSQVYNALLELYLRDSQKEECREKRTEQVVEMLQNDTARYDPDHALLLMQLYRLQPGIVILCEKRGLYQHVLDCYCEDNEYKSIMDLCWRRGTEEASLWVQALRYFAVREDEESREHVAEILQYIEQKNLLPPLMVVKALSENAKTPISVLMNYITRHIQIEEEQTNENEILIKKYSEEATKMREEIKKLKTEPVIFQTNKCTQCVKKLNLPAVHLLCKHSWHQQVCV